MSRWELAQSSEADWWGDCANTYQEETKQRIIFAPKLGLREAETFSVTANGRWPVYDLNGLSVLDIGGGPISLLLKCVNMGAGSCVLDPCNYPEWTRQRYASHGINVLKIPAENLDYTQHWNEVWIYNVLQHVIDPAKIIENAKSVADVVRIVEWIELETDDKHTYRLSEDDLNDWLQTTGEIEWIDNVQSYIYTACVKND